MTRFRARRSGCPEQRSGHVTSWATTSITPREAGPATTVMVPLDGKIREGVGLLGSPPFEIPRSVERDARYDHLRTGEALTRGLAAKNRFNLRTIGIFLL